jgi:adenine-specific DNA-methyltransferase
MRPEVGTQAQFRKQKPPAKYRYDDSLDPAMSWDEGSAAREQGEALIRARAWKRPCLPPG